MDSQALERSALERKDREELQTIALALGGKPPSRARKADIVDLILELAGVTPAAPSASSAADAAPASAPAPSASDNGDADTPPAAASATRRRTRKPADTSAESSPGSTSTGSPDEGAGSDAEADSAATTATGVPAGADGDGDGAGAVSTTGDDAGSTDASTTPDGDTAVASREGRGGARGEARSDSRGEGRNDRRPEDRNRQGQGQDRQGQDRQGQDRQGQDRQGQDRQGQDRQDRQGQDRQGQDRQGQDGQGQGDDGEPGNRRRRRRGRDRDRERGPEPRVEESVQLEPVEVSGLLDLRDDGYGFLRLKGYLPSKDDVYLSVKQVRQFGLRKGDHLVGSARPASRNEKNPALLRIDLVNGEPATENRDRRRFEDLTPLFPDEKLRLEVPGDQMNMTARIIDLIAPIGKGQRGLIVSPPKAGKTTVMKQIARSIELNSPDVHLMVLLIDERPEEVTDFRRWLLRGEVVASTFDRPSDEHTTVAELAIERAKRMVEEGRDVVIILDGITRLARAYNLAAPASGRIMSGGIDAGALYPPKRFFGAARNVEEGGSLTILATALVETNSKMDEHIFEEFKGTGNMELKLDRRMAERRIYPAIDVDASSTRHEELLFDRKQLQMVWKLRRVLSGLASEGSAGAGLEMLIDRLSSFKSNDEFLSEIAKAPTGA